MTRRPEGLSGATVLIFVVFLFAALWFTNQFDQKDKELTWKEFINIVSDNGDCYRQPE